MKTSPPTDQLTLGAGVGQARRRMDAASAPKQWRAVRPHTDHATALAYASKGWGAHKTRDDWEESLRSKEPKNL